jgi:hypothetical protein
VLSGGALAGTLVEATAILGSASGHLGCIRGGACLAAHAAVLLRQRVHVQWPLWCSVRLCTAAAPRPCCRHSVSSCIAGDTRGCDTIPAVTAGHRVGGSIHLCGSESHLAKSPVSGYSTRLCVWLIIGRRRVRWAFVKLSAMRRCRDGIPAAAGTPDVDRCRRTHAHKSEFATL